MAERKDAVVNRKQAAVVEPALDYSLPKPNVRQLAMRYHPMLSFNDLTERPSRRRPLQMRIKFASHFIENLMHMRMSRHGAGRWQARPREWRAHWKIWGRCLERLRRGYVNDIARLRE